MCARCRHSSLILRWACTIYCTCRLFSVVSIKSIAYRVYIGYTKCMLGEAQSNVIIIRKCTSFPNLLFKNINATNNNFKDFTYSLYTVTVHIRKSVNWNCHTLIRFTCLVLVSTPHQVSPICSINPCVYIPVVSICLLPVRLVSSSLPACFSSPCFLVLNKSKYILDSSKQPTFSLMTALHTLGFISTSFMK